MTATVESEPPASLAMLLRALKLPTTARHAEEVALLAERDGWTFTRYLHHLVELEVHERRRRRIERYRKDSLLPEDKTLATLTRSRLPIKVAKMLATLCEGGFVERGDNLLAFGLPGRGKTHLVCAIAHELIQRGYRVLFIATFALVQRLLAAKRDLRLEHELGILDGYAAVVLDDIGYVQQNRDEMEVLFTFLAERYERRTVIITSNLVFSEWDRIFKDPMTTAAAIDRLVHHSVIVEMTGPSIRVDQAQSERVSQGGHPATTAEPSYPATTAEPSSVTAPAATQGAIPTTTTPTTTTSPLNSNPATQGSTPTTATASPNANPVPQRAVPTTTAPTTTTSSPPNSNPATQGSKSTTTAAPLRPNPFPHGGKPTTATPTRTKNRDHSSNDSDGEM